MCIECTRPESDLGAGDPDECIYEPHERHPRYIDEEISDRRQWPTDSHGKQYNPYAGSVTPSEGKCNATLENYEERYGEKRYCSRPPIGDFGPEGVSRCYSHRTRVDSRVRAKKVASHGVYAQSMARMYEHLNAMKRVLLLSIYDSLVADSQYDFDPEIQTQQVSFAEYDGPIPLEIASELDGETLDVEIPVPTTKTDRCFHLYLAAADTLSSLSVKQLLFEDGYVDETEQVVGEYEDDDGNVQQITSTELDEHPANLIYSRLTRDKSEHLEYGGVTLDDTADVAIDMGDSEIITSVSPKDVQRDDTHPNTLTEETETNPLHDPTLVDDE